MCYLIVWLVVTSISHMNAVFFCFLFGATAPSGPGPSHSRGFLTTHNDAPQSVGLLWTSDRLVAETSTWQYTTLTTNIHAPGGIRTHNISRRAATDLRLRPRGHWDRLNEVLVVVNTHKDENKTVVLRKAKRWTSGVRIHLRTFIITAVSGPVLGLSQTPVKWLPGPAAGAWNWCLCYV